MADVRKLAVFFIGVGLPQDGFSPILLAGLCILARRGVMLGTVGDEDAVARVYCKTGVESACSCLGVRSRLLFKPAPRGTFVLIVSLDGDMLDLKDAGAPLNTCFGFSARLIFCWILFGS